MRRAGWLLGLFLVACGGAGPAGGPDGGTGGLTTPDSGVDPSPDAGPPADCAGLLPPAPASAFTFDVVSGDTGETCDSSAIDGEGVVAAAARKAGSTTWYLYAPSYGTRSGNFGAPGEVVPQARGFIGLWGVKPLNVALFNQGGDPGQPSPVGDGPVVLGPAQGGGAISLAVDSSGVTVRKHDATAMELSAATISGASAPLAAAEDASGAVLALIGNGSEVSGAWVDLTHATVGKPFAAGTGSSAVAKPLLGGGVAVQIDGRWAGIAQPGQSSLQPAPAWLSDAADFAVARGGKAYATLPKSGSALGIVSPQGSVCGTVTFAGVSGTSVGVDGTVVGATGVRGCTKFVWRNALR